MKTIFLFMIFLSVASAGTSGGSATSEDDEIEVYDYKVPRPKLDKEEHETFIEQSRQEARNGKDDDSRRKDEKMKKGN